MRESPLNNSNIYLLNHVLWRTDVVCVPVNFFFHCLLIFTLLAASISLFFFTAAIKFSLFFLPMELVSFVFLSGSFSIIHVNVDIKI